MTTLPKCEPPSMYFSASRASSKERCSGIATSASSWNAPYSRRTPPSSPSPGDRRDVCHVRAFEPVRVVDGADAFADFPTRHDFAHGDDLSRAVGERHGREARVLVIDPSVEEHVAVVQRRGVKLDDDF